MNTGFLDAHNLAWKIHAVESGFAHRSILATYESERMHVAKRLIDFDAAWARLFSQKHQVQPDGEAMDNDFVKAFKSNSEFTSGYGVSYPANDLNIDPSTPTSASALFMNFPEETNLQGGHYFPPMDVIRVLDGEIVHLEQAVPFNGAFRIYIFAGNPRHTTNETALADFAKFSMRQGSYLSSYLRSNAEKVTSDEISCQHSRFYAICTILAARCPDTDIYKMLPEFLLAYHHHVYLDDGPHDAGTEQIAAVAHAKIGISTERPAVVVVRPDGYVGCVIRLVTGPGTVQALNAYYARFVTKTLRDEIDGRILANL